ncbi:DUF4381 domain-containing protein [Aurantivibrio plasticivorans]
MNSNDPLAQLRDIHLPPEIGLWPIALGWWIVLAVIIIAAVGVIVFFLNKRRGGNHYRQQALSLLDVSWHQYQASGDARQHLAELTRILRRTAITAYPHYPIQSLSGKCWLRFLDACDDRSNSEFSNGAGQAIATLPYQESINQDLKPLHQCVKMWIINHRNKVPTSIILRIFSDANISFIPNDSSMVAATTQHATRELRHHA